MRYSNQGRFRQQVRFLRRQFLQDGDLAVQQCPLGGGRRASADGDQRVLVGQDLFAAGHAVGLPGSGPECRPFLPCGSRSLDRPSDFAGAMSVLCGDRRLLPGQEASARRVLLERGPSDGTCVGERASTRSGFGKHAASTSTTDRRSRCPIRRRTSARTRNPTTQKPGLGFPLARIAAVFSLACGAVLDVGICRYAGKGQSELGMLRTLWNLFRPGDVMLADRLMCTWTEMVMLKQRGVDCVCRLTSHRKADFRRGKRLGKDDHIVKWPKPTKPRSIDRKTYDALPEFLMIRECRVRVEQPGFRIKTLIVATTLLDADEFTKDDLAQLYRARWNAELDLRSLKQTLQMDVLRCKTPELVRKELWTHILAYNLIRTIMAQAATKHGIEPRSISFKGAIQTLEAFQPVIALQGEHRLGIPPDPLRALARRHRHPPRRRSARPV